jgi:chromosome segregation ATPase
MEPVTLNSLWIIIGIIMASGGAVVSAFKIIGAAKDRISKLEGRVYNLERALNDNHEQTSSLVDTIKDIQESLSDIRITQTEMRVTLIGSDGQNGLRAELRELKTELRELVNKI